MTPDLAGRVALVTGGSRGLGREMALAFANAGADVVIASRKFAACEEVAELVRQRGRRALPIACHVGRWDELESLVDATYDEFGRLDVLVNNAGMAPLYESLDAVSEALFDKVIDVNLKGPFRLTAVAAPRMVAAGRGSIINVSSIGSQFPQWSDLPYAAAKAGLETLTVGFAGAYGPAVRVNTIAVGPFLTDISDAWDVEGFTKFAAEHYPLGRLGQPSEIVGTALYLASDLSSFTTGATITVDGGIAVSSRFPGE